MRKLFGIRGHLIDLDHGGHLVGVPEAFEQKRMFQYAFLIQQGLKPEHVLIDIGCGVLRGGVPLIKYLDANKYYGLDVNLEALEVAKRTVKKEGVQEKGPSLLHVRENLQKIQNKKMAHVIWAFSVLIHMTDEKVADCLEFVRNNIRPDGVFYANVNIGEVKDGAWREFPVKWRSIKWYKDQAQKYELSMEELGILETFGHKSLTDIREDQQIMLRFKKLG